MPSMLPASDGSDSEAQLLPPLEVVQIAPGWSVTALPVPVSPMTAQVLELMQSTSGYKQPGLVTKAVSGLVVPK